MSFVSVLYCMCRCSWLLNHYWSGLRIPVELWQLKAKHARLEDVATYLTAGENRSLCPATLGLSTRRLGAYSLGASCCPRSASYLAPRLATVRWRSCPAPTEVFRRSYLGPSFSLSTVWSLVLLSFSLAPAAFCLASVQQWAATPAFGCTLGAAVVLRRSEFS